MKKLLVIASSILILSISCKKTIDRVKRDYLMELITGTRWYLENYTENGINKTIIYKDYEFEFYETGKLDAFRSAVVTLGTWVANTDKLTLTVNFISGDTLQNLNHEWRFLDNNSTVVLAETTTNTGKKTIRLRKK